MIRLDAIDHQLLGLLQHDSKQTNKALANKLNLSITAVYERIKKLERNGVIRNYAALIDPEKVSRAFIAFCQIKLIQHSEQHIKLFEKEILRLKEVLSCYHISGEYDYIIKIYVENMAAYREFMVTKLTAIAHIGSTQSSFVINELKNSTAIEL
ncbi:Lrp/AsnC family transcriptional regulator [Gangjinia marincola]|uniref:Lrp/AsnC family transcriptional regulator n=1 Tax=Gangjinia marincola TaxID=578463 RepID=A0ABP3XU62_9FLAO